jgi:hypothetical protein
MSITARALLVEHNISVWTANKLDKNATDVVISQNCAADKAAQVRKNLMAGSSQRKDIADFAAGCRLWHNTKTLPWANSGARMLPTSMFMDYKQELNDRKAQFDSMVSQFLIDYPQLVQISQNFLGSLFNANDYPHVEEVAEKFGYRFVFSPVPDSGHFALDVASEELNDLREQYEADFTTRVNDAMKDAWTRLHKTLTGMSEKLTDAPDEKKRRFHDSFITNAQDLCGLLSHLNVNNDPELEKARRGLETALLGTDVDVIKDSEYARGELKAKVDSVLDQFEW